MYSEINVSVEDGNLGRSTSSGTGIQVKIGVSNIHASTPVLITGSMKPAEIKEKLGCTPLADACIDATENGLNTIYAVSVPADINGEINSYSPTGTGTGSLMLEGNPNNAFEIVVEITETGNVNEGAFIYSIDGGNSFSDELTIPLAGTYKLTATGLTLRFADGVGEESKKSFLAGDHFKFSTTAPTLSNESVLKAVEGLKDFNVKNELIHIVGSSTKSLWAALQTVAQEFLTEYKNPCIFLCEGRACKKDEKLEDYIEAMRQERKGISSYFISVILSYGIYQRKDLRVQNINLAGVITGLLGKAKESLSVGYVKQFPVSSAKLQKLLPEGIEKYTKTLDEIGYTVFRQYTGLEDYYVSNANTFAPEGSDFPYIENVRVLDRIIREINVQATYNIQREIDPEQLEASVKAIEADLNIPLESCISDNIISSGNVTINTNNLNILSDESLNVQVEWVPMGSARKFNITFGVNNPYVSAD